jgi:hypothetical protein
MTGAVASPSMNNLPCSIASTSHFTRAGFAFLALSLGTACSVSDGTAATDGGESTDGESSTDGSTASDGSHAADGGVSTEAGGHAGDGGASSDTGTGISTQAVNLRTAGNFVVLAMSGISTVPTSAITGDLGVSPAAATAMTGFSPTMDSSGTFSTSPQVTGRLYASDYTPPTPSNLTTAISDMLLAFTDAAGRAPNVTELGAGNIGGMTLTAGVYEWSTGLDVPTDLTLTGTATDVWVFQIAQNLTVSSATQIVLAGGAVPKNVFWEVAGSASLGTTAHFAGTILSQASIAFETGASIDGRLLAQTAVSLDSSVVIEPTP